MIVGTVNSRNELTVPLQLRDSANQLFDLEPMIDIGFTGSLTLPFFVCHALSLPKRS